MSASRRGSSRGLGRRDFIALAGAAAASGASPARAQQALPVIGYLHSANPASRRDVTDAFVRGLGEAGFVDGRNVAIAYRWADNQSERLPDLAADLVRLRVTTIFAGGPITAQAAKGATAAIPIVFTSGDDPVKAGLVASLNRPGGNITGINIFLSAMESKRLGLLRELMPAPALIGVLVNPRPGAADLQLTDIRTAADALGQKILIINASSEQDIHRAFVTFSQEKIAALLVTADPLYNSQRAQLATLAAHHSIPAIYELRDYAVSGGLMSYGTDLPDAYRQAGIYVGRILKGEKPSDLPVMQSTKFEFVINLKTAKALGLTIPPTVLARADEVIE